MRVCITGGAGFIGTNLTRGLLGNGSEVVVLDNFSEQIHGSNRDLPADIAGHVELVRGDIRDRATLEGCLARADAVVHLAAETGTGQSMYKVAHYADVNMMGTSLLMDIAVNNPSLPISKIVVASSRAVYGEGSYHCLSHGRVYPAARTARRMAAGQFEPECPACGADCTSLPTREDTPFSPSSFYGLTKQVEEQAVLLLAQAIQLDAFALRYQNVYGPGQSLTNPYTGILAIFSGLARKNEEIRIFEDGLESRDFVYIDDVVDATIRALSPEATGIKAVNVGSGRGTSVAEVAESIRDFFGSDSPIRVTGEFRVGDIRHNTADLERADREFGFQPRTPFDQGLKKFLDWAAGNDYDVSGYQRSLTELQDLNLMNK